MATATTQPQPSYALPQVGTVPPELVAQLYAPLAPEAITPHPTKDYLSSIKAIYVIERLNEVFGIGGWTYTVRVVERGECTLVPDRRAGAQPGAMKEKAGMIVVRVILQIPAYGVRLEHFGGSDNEDRGDAYKGAVTDALSKIASYLGIGIDVYKGGGRTKRNPRGTAVSQSRLAAVPQQSAAPRPPQPAVGVIEGLPEFEYEEIPESQEIPEPESKLEQELADSIRMVNQRKNPASAPISGRPAWRIDMLRSFALMANRYRAIRMEHTYFAILALHGVREMVEFPETPEGRDQALKCHRDMMADITRREQERRHA